MAVQISSGNVAIAPEAREDDRGPNPLFALWGTALRSRKPQKGQEAWKFQNTPLQYLEVSLHPRYATNDIDIFTHSRGTMRSIEPLRFGSHAGDVVSTDKLPWKQISLLDLPTDLFLELLQWLEIPDMFNVRMTLWALPLSDVPPATLEHLTLRALRMRRLWDGGNPKTKRKLSKFIQRPRESITWIRLICSRWVVIQQSGATLELWDLEDVAFQQPALTINSFEGIVDGSVVRSEAERTVAMMISTRSCKVGRIQFFLPYPKAGGGSASARVVDSFGDFSRLMDADEQLAAFLQHQGNRGNFIRDMVSGAVPQQPFGIQLKRQVVAVATAGSVDLYWRKAIIATLRSPEPGGVAIQPFQRLTYPPASLRGSLKETTIANAIFLTKNPQFVSLPSGEDTIYLSAQGRSSGQILYVAQPVEITDQGPLIIPPTYVLLPPTVLFCLGPYNMLFYDPGQSGRRPVFVVDEPRGLSLCGVSVPRDLSWPTQGSAKRGYIGWWRITDSSSRDLVHHVAFEEATGTCAIAMGSGRLWVVDLTAAEVMPQNPNEHLDIPVS
ncbi:hypothetical protein FRC00_003188 [Tulasnella sp. 408]|nr:hypothetical protein FRC00_003188 [Tulasnella sp. 408]